MSYPPQLSGSNKMRGALMGILNWDHPDIEKFVYAKKDNNGESVLKYFNISVGVTDSKKFLQLVEEDGYIELQHKVTGVTGKIKARELLRKMAEQAWKTGDPGIIKLDEINKLSPYDIHIEATNPCVTGDTMVSTEYGLLRIDELYKRFEHGGINVAADTRALVKDAAIIMAPIAQAFNNGEKEVMHLITEEGYELKATPDHKIMTDRGWVETQHLQPGDKVLIQSGEGLFAADDKLPFEVQNEFIGDNNRVYKHNLPTKWSRELGQVLGWIVADGFIHNSDKVKSLHIAFGKNKIEALNYVKSIMDEMYGKPGYTSEKARGVQSLNYESKYFVEFFEKLGIKRVKSGDKEVPHAIFTAPKEAVIGFLQGLFTCDGTVNSKDGTNYVRLSSKSLKLIKQVQLLLSNLGIYSNIYDRSRKPREKAFEYTKVNGETAYYESGGVLYELNISKESMQKFARMIPLLTTAKNDRLQSLLKVNAHADQYFARVLSVQPIGKQVVYDVTEPLTHSFIANAIVLHNCGEEPLPAGGSCNLGSVDVYKIPDESLAQVIRTAVEFLLLVTYANNVPLKKQQEMLHNYRPVGLGMMGFAKWLIDRGIRYGSDESVQAAEKLLENFTYYSYKAAEELADIYSTFPKYDVSKHADPNFKPWATNNPRLVQMVADRHANGRKLCSVQINTMAPTGTISMLADTSSGLEPEFMLSYTKTITHRDGSKESLQYTLPEVEAFLKQIEEDEAVVEYVRTHGKLPQYASDEAKRVLVTSHDVTPSEHLAMLKTFASYIDASVSKTINMPNNATVEDVLNIYKEALAADGIKGITIYRDGSLETQVLRAVDDDAHKEKEKAKENTFIINKDKKLLPKKMGAVVNSYTTRFKTPKSTTIVTLSVDDDGEPAEVFVYNGGEKAEIIGRLMSIAMRSGVDIRELIKQLKKCSGEFTTRLAEEIEKLIEYSKAEDASSDIADDKHQDNNTPDFSKMTLVKGFYYVDDEGNKYCAHCHAKNTISYEDGCVACKECGASACTVS